MSDERTRIADEVRRLHRAHQFLLDEAEDCREVPTLWDLVDHALLWRVFLDDVLEPDVDVEILHEVIVVRGAHDALGPPRRHALLPVPAPFAVRHREVHFVSGVLEIRIERAR